MTTKGDLSVTDGTDYYRLPVGTNGQVLYADSTQAAGIKWATPAEPSIKTINMTANRGYAYSKVSSGSYSYTTTRKIITVRLVSGGQKGGGTAAAIDATVYLPNASGGTGNIKAYLAHVGDAGASGKGLLLCLTVPIGTVVSGSVGAGGSGSAGAAGGTTNIQFTISSITYNFQIGGGNSGSDLTITNTYTGVVSCIFFNESYGGKRSQTVIADSGASAYARNEGGRCAISPADGYGGHTSISIASADYGDGGSGSVDIWERD
jgi:hypothetical protein